MLKRVLVANRGEIACRIMRTCRRLGVETIAVYSDADRDAHHVALADQALRLGPPPAAESYLRGDRIIEAALSLEAEAIHPGYGFLSENADFAEAVGEAGLRFIGPPPEAIRAMGFKDAAKTLMAEAGVPIVPGYHGAEQDPELLSAEADRIGYPVLIKARAGGGGKGMRKVEQPRDFAAALESARQEAQASFGDAACLIEKWINGPRHIEIQVFADDHGNVVHLFERDCSLQRRHQKVIEEAPAPGMGEEMRRAMGEAATQAARAIGYSGAGTVEFIADASEGLRPDRFWFMEMNTRLQVEHPVTEFITGVDLVEWQLRVASGEPLPKAQENLAIDGWAFEARIYAEDAGKGFLPATGRLDYFSMPDHLARIDSGVIEGDEITPHYDPMIAKLIVQGPSRQAALGRLQAALREVRLAGTVTNVEFLAALASHQEFHSGEFDTGFIDQHLDDLLETKPPPLLAMALAAIAATGRTSSPKSADPWTCLTGFRLWSADRQYVALEVESETIEVAVETSGGDLFYVAGAGASATFAVVATDGARWQIDMDGHLITAWVVVGRGEVTVFADGRAYRFGVPDPLIADEEAEFSGNEICAPMPGLVRSVLTEVGATVAKGDPLIIMLAMKMEHTLLAPRDGCVAELLVAEGDQIEGEALMLSLTLDEA